tara:strand:+ start:426 stop:1055 length:630 start_codon:yes stop_codon:yes gene_type:complete
MTSCSKCGGPITNAKNKNCDYCGAIILNNDGEFVDINIFNSYQEFLDNFKVKIKKYEEVLGKIEIPKFDNLGDIETPDDKKNRMTAEINNLYIPKEPQDISIFAQYLKSRIVFSTNPSTQNLMSSFANDPVPGAWVAKADELSTSIKFTNNNTEIIRFADVLDEVIKEGNDGMKEMAANRGNFNKNFLFSFLIFAMLVGILTVVVISTV